MKFNLLTGMQLMSLLTQQLSIKTQTLLTHKTIAYISDEPFFPYNLCYPTNVVQIKRIIPNVSFVHYWTASPSSQYRNKHIFNIILQHESVFDTEAACDYFEAGHGKGPCDGLGMYHKNNG